MEKIIWENLLFEETRKVSWPDNKIANQLSFHHGKYNEISEFGEVFLIRDKRQVVVTAHPKKLQRTNYRKNCGTVSYQNAKKREICQGKNTVF